MLSLLVATVLVTKPSVIVILADDVGYGDLGSYGATKTKTPNLDKLASQGIRFTDAHSPSTVCTPTRYAMLTGQYAFRNPKGAGILSGAAPLSIPTDTATLPKVMQSAGYTTGVVGKWHLGLGAEQPTNYNGLIQPGPKEVGFDYSFIMPATGDRVPCVYVENGRVVGYDPKDPIQVSYGKKVGDEPTGRENPELLKLKPLVGHADTIVNGVSRIGFMSGGKKARWNDETMADIYTKKALSFIGKNRKKPFFLYLATHDIHAPQLPNKRFEGTADSGLRGFALAELDWTVGEVMKTLDKAKLTENTILIFTSDNGGVDNDGYGDPRENLNGHRVNGELRGFKYELYEGGHRVPFILRWPGHAKAGSMSHELISHVDLLASLRGMVDAPTAVDPHTDSQDLAGALLGGGQGRSSLVLHLGGAKSPLAYRKGKWALVPSKAAWELYDLSVDLGQKRNVASENPELVAQLVAELATVRDK